MRSLRISSPAGIVLALVACLVASPWLAADDVNPDAQELFKKALEFRQANDMDRAMDSLLRSYHVDPGVLSLNDEGLIKAILKHLKDGLHKSPHDVTLTFKMAEFLNISGRLEQAVKFYEKVVSLQPSGHLAQTAQLEADRLKQMIPEETPPPSVEPSPDEGDPPPDGETDPDASPSPGAPETASDTKVKDLEKQLEDQKLLVTRLEQEKKKIQEDLDKLKKDFADLQVQANKYKSIQNLYFSGQGAR